jgi:death-on-curing protein
VQETAGGYVFGSADTDGVDTASFGRRLPPAERRRDLCYFERFVDVMAERDEGFDHLTVEDVLTLHEVIVGNGDDTEPGLSARGDIEYVVEHLREGHFGRGPTTIYQKAVALLRLLVANHPFVDGNKRTALSSTVVFYALNGRDLEYGPEIKDVLKRFATDEASVDTTDVIEYVRANTFELPNEYAATYQVLRDLGAVGGSDPESEQNGRADDNPTDESRMAADDSTATSIRDLSPAEARSRLLRLIARQDMDEHEEIYEALEYE